ncbi:MAG: class I SAM-dependent DNA methyltransferase [Paracoccaceae bacterium]
MSEAPPDEIDFDALAEAYNAGLAAERAGDRAGAAEAYARALAIDPHDRGGVSVRLAALGAAPDPDGAPPAYVATLFDQTAPDFDEILVERLGYAVPMLLRERLGDLGVRNLGRVLDLGCGTGLAGLSLADLSGPIIGCDLSEEMVAEAHERGVYADLYVGEAVAFLGAWGEEPGEDPFDTVVACDVLPYLGAVERLFAGVARVLAPDGRLAVSSETLPAEGFAGRDWRVGPNHRFAHAEGYLRKALTEAGFSIDHLEPITVRHESGRAVPGHLVIARRV